MKPRDIILLSVCTAVTLICLWGSLQIAAPMLADAAATLNQVPNLVAALVSLAAVTYVLKALLE